MGTETRSIESQLSLTIKPQVVFLTRVVQTKFDNISIFLDILLEIKNIESLMKKDSFYS